MTYRCKHFSIYELVPEELYDSLHEDLLWDMFDENILRFADWLKDFCGGASVTVNTWMWGGNHSQSGIRSKTSKYYSEGSMHSIGKALDLKVEGFTSEALRRKLKDFEENVAPVPYVTRIEEDTIGWLHADTKETFSDEIYYFNP